MINFLRIVKFEFPKAHRPLGPILLIQNHYYIYPIEVKPLTKPKSDRHFLNKLACFLLNSTKKGQRNRVTPFHSLQTTVSLKTILLHQTDKLLNCLEQSIHHLHQYK